LTLHFAPDDRRTLQTRLSAFVAERATAKQLARLIGCDVRTAEGIRKGYWPQARHFSGIVRAFGRDVIDAVFAPEIDSVEARLEQEERQARQVYLAARARRQAVLRAPDVDPDPLLPFEELDRRAPEHEERL
jgi:hypothetical protein